jgi:hypothetical protein
VSLFDFSTCAFDPLLPPIAGESRTLPVLQDELLVLTASINDGVLAAFASSFADPSSSKTMGLSIAKKAAQEIVTHMSIVVPPVAQVGLGFAEKVVGKVRAELRRRTFYDEAAQAVDAFLASLPEGRHRFVLCDAVLTPMEVADIYLRRNKASAIAAEEKLLAAASRLGAPGDASALSKQLERMRAAFVTKLDEVELRAAQAAACAEAAVNAGLAEVAAEGGFGAAAVDAATTAARMAVPALYLLPTP